MSGPQAFTPPATQVSVDRARVSAGSAFVAGVRGYPMLKSISLSLIALTAATPATAQTTDTTLANDIVVTASGIEQPRDEVGQAITVIDAETIEQRQTVDVVDLLATTSGVRFNRTGSTGSVAGISIRGAETTQTLVLIDGVKVNDPSGIGDGYDFGHLLTGNISRIEVLRGSNSVVHGSQAIGGVVSLMTAERQGRRIGHRRARIGRDRRRLFPHRWYLVGRGRHRKGRLQEFRRQRPAEDCVQRRAQPRPARLLHQRRPRL